MAKNESSDSELSGSFEYQRLIEESCGDHDSATVKTEVNVKCQAEDESGLSSLDANGSPSKRSKSSTRDSNFPSNVSADEGQVSPVPSSSPQRIWYEKYTGKGVSDCTPKDESYLNKFKKAFNIAKLVISSGSKTKQKENTSSCKGVSEEKEPEESSCIEPVSDKTSGSISASSMDVGAPKTQDQVSEEEICKLLLLMR